LPGRGVLESWTNDHPPNFDETVARAERENNVILSGEFSGTGVAYLATERDLGVVLEVFSGTPDDEAS
jgi:hypothetical protein